MQGFFVTTASLPQTHIHSHTPSLSISPGKLSMPWMHVEEGVMSTVVTVKAVSRGEVRVSTEATVGARASVT
jgi:hypothetical protein